MIYGIQIPDQYLYMYKKPRDIKNLLDTMEMRKFGDQKMYTPLSLLCAILDIPSPKDDIDGSMVSEVYRNT